MKNSETIETLRQIRRELSRMIAENELAQSAVREDKNIKNNMLLMALISIGHRLDDALSRCEIELRYKGEIK